MPRADRPNILFVFSDQQRYDTLPACGNPHVVAPNLGRLAEEGTVFDHAYANCPICGPYRGQLVTGRYSHANGVVDNEYALASDQPSLATALRGVGYRTGYVGKWHLGYGPYAHDAARHGFDHLWGYNCDHRHYQLKFHRDGDGPFEIDKWGPEGETDLAIEMMGQFAAAGEPFCQVLSWGPPHWPYELYPGQYRIYDPARVPVRGNVPRPLEDWARREIADYYGNITALDTQFGRLLAALDRLGLAQDTLVIFTSDHGDHLRSHGYGQPGEMAWLHPSKAASKATPHEESVHVPMLARWPGVLPAGGRDATFVGSVDLMPTFCGLAGADVPAGVQGRDLSAAFRGKSVADPPDSVYLQILGPGWPHRGQWVGFWRGVRDARFTYARWRDRDQIWLFDREADPLEMNNLAGDPAHAELRGRMEQRLQRWIADTADPFDTGPRDPQTGMLALGQRFSHDRWLTGAGGGWI